MDSSLLSRLARQTSGTDRMAGRGPDPATADVATSDPGGFSRALTAAAAISATPEAATVRTGCADLVSGATVASPAIAGASMATPDAGVPVGTLMLRRVLAEARTVSERLTETVTPEADEPIEPDEPVKQDDTTVRKSPRSERVDDVNPPASTGTNIALMQWMLQLAPQPLTPVPAAAREPQQQPAESAPLVLGRQDGLALLQSALPAVLSGRPESVSRDRDLANRATALNPRETGVGVTATTLPDAVKTRSEFPARMPAEMVASNAAVPADGVHVMPPVEPRAWTALSASTPSAADVHALLPVAAQVAAAASTGTTTATPSGSPIPAPAQTWIQTPVTQPGFSDEVVVELVRRVGQAEQGTHALTLHLNPEELGPVSVSIELNGSAARIEFAASEALTRHHLEAALPGLTQALQDQGVSLTQGGVHEASKESLAASAAGGQTSGGTGSDARQRDEALFDGRSGYGERAPRRETEMFAIDGLAVSEARVPASNGPSPGRAGRLDLFA